MKLVLGIATHILLGESVIMIRMATRLLILCAAVQIFLCGQSPPGAAVTGTVLDPHQAAVLGAKVTLKRADGAEQSAAADSTGTFRFAGVAPGTYEVRVEQEGFKPSVLRVRVGNQTLPIQNGVLAL